MHSRVQRSEAAAYLKATMTERWGIIQHPKAALQATFSKMLTVDGMSNLMCSNMVDKRANGVYAFLQYTDHFLTGLSK